LVLAGCGEEKGYTFVEPNSSTVWTPEEGIHTIDWHSEKGGVLLGEGSVLLLYKGEEALGPLGLMASEKERKFVVLHPQGVPEGTDYRLWFQDNEGRAGFSDYFAIKR
jgi:hypothetical protein